MQRLALIIGSGLSVPYGLPDAKQLTDCVNVGGTYLRSVVQYYPAGAKPRDNTETWPVTEMLWEALRANYEQPNFETYVHALETLVPMAASRRVPKYFGFLDDYRPVAMAFMDVLARYEPFMRSEVLQAERLNVMVRLLERLNVEPFDIGAKKARAHLLQTITRITGSFNSNVLTLNYDDLIDDALSDYFDGFSIATADGAAFRFDRSAFVRDGPPDNSFFHLHGSARFGYLRESEVLPEVVKYTSRSEALDSVRAAITEAPSMPGEAVHAGRIHSTAPIISGIGKADKVMLTPTPFGFYYNAAVQQILAAKRMLVVGYGCRDPHINTWTREAAAVHDSDYRVAFVTSVPVGQRLRYINVERQAISSFLGPVEPSASESWFDTGNDIISFGSRLMVVRSGVPLSDEAIDAILEFLK